MTFWPDDDHRDIESGITGDMEYAGIVAEIDTFPTPAQKQTGAPEGAGDNGSGFRTDLTF
jgi:hypothetical protein